MARLAKNEATWHRITIKTKDGGEMILMGRPNRLELSIWCPKTDQGRSGFVWFSGQKALRTLAKEILNAKPRRRVVNGNGEPK